MTASGENRVPEWAEGRRPTIADLVEVAPVDTVVRLDGRPGRLSELVLTGDVVAALSAALAAAAGRDGGAFFLVGHFGSGKSHFLAALAELCREPAASVLAGWDASLQAAALAAAARRAVVAVPLVEHRAGAHLDDVVLGAAHASLGRPRGPASAAPRGPSVPSGTDRREVWDGVLAAAGDGLVVLLDELSEFLRAKQGPALVEDLRFLQFLGEWADGRPVVVVAALQESIEEVANVSQRELGRIRDRYRTLTLSMRHVEDLVRGRLVGVRPGADDWIRRAHRELETAFPGWAVPLERFERCYPVHPATLSVLEGLRFLFSQQRGVVDFICRQLLGDPLAGISPWQDRDYLDLLGPDRVYDHFRARLQERIETRRLAESVVPYWERAADDRFETPADRELALRAVKLLALLSASPLERPRTAAEIAHLLAVRLSALDPGANVAYLERAILEPLAAAGAYIVGRGGPPPVFTVELEADAAEVALARLTQARAEVAAGDRRVVHTLADVGSSATMPLGLLFDLGPARRELLWQNTLRSVLVALARVPELAPPDAVALVTQARSVGAEGVVLVGEPELEGAGSEEHARALVAAADRLAVWVPAPLPPGDVDAALELHSRRLVLEAAVAEGRTEPGGLVEFLERSGAGDAARAREILHRAYFGGEVVVGPERPFRAGEPGPERPFRAGEPGPERPFRAGEPGPERPFRAGEPGPERPFRAGERPSPPGIDLPTLAGLAFDRLLASVADPLLLHLHPLHREVAPRGDLVGGRVLRQLITEVLSRPRISSAAADGAQLRSLVTAYLVPMGLVRRRGDAWVVAPDAARSPAVSEALRLVSGGEPVATTEVVRELADGPVGLTEPEALLVLNACVQAGLLEARRGRNALTEPFLAVTPTDRLSAGELLEPLARAVLAGLGPIVGRGPFEPWSSPVQRAVWERARAWLEARREDVAAVTAGMAAVADMPALSAIHTEPVTDDLARVGAMVDGNDPGLAPVAGLQRLVSTIDDTDRLLASARRLAAVARFFREELAKTAQGLAYLTHSQLELPDSEPRLRALRDEARRLAGDVLGLAAEDRVGELVTLEGQFRLAYEATYRDGHDRYHAGAGAQQAAAVRASPAYRALATLSGLGAVAVPDDRVKVDRALAAAIPARCERRLDLELAWKPRCTCGYALGEEPPAVDVEGAVATAERGVAQYLAELGGAEHRVALERAVDDLAGLGRDELAADLRRLLVLVADPVGADRIGLTHLLDGPLTGVVGDVLGGGRLVVRRDLAPLREDLIGRRYPKRRLLELIATWVDPAGDLPAGGFVEVIDSHEVTATEAGAGGPSVGAGASGGGPTGGVGRSGPAARPALSGRSGPGPALSGRSGPGPALSGRSGPGPAGATAWFLAQRFPRLATLLPPDRPAEAFWLAAWWGERAGAPTWLPTALLAEAPTVAVAAEAARSDLGALAELAELDARIGPSSLLGDQVAAALALGDATSPEIAAVLAEERLLRHPLRLAADQLLCRLALDGHLTERLPDLAPARLAAAHALVSEAELAPLGHVLAATRHLAQAERCLAALSARDLVEDVYPAHLAAVPELLSRAELASVGGALVGGEALEAVGAAAQRMLRAADAVFAEHASTGFAGCLRMWEVGQAILGPLLRAHDRVAVLVVDAMRVDLWGHVGQEVGEALPGRSMRQSWAVVPEPTRTAESMAALYLGRPVPAGAGPASPADLGLPFSHLGFESTALVGADRDGSARALRELWADGPRISVAAATGVDELLHRSSVELADLLDEAMARLRRRVLPTLAALPSRVPLVVLSDHGFRERRSWGRGPDGRWAHGGLSLEECVVPVAVFDAVE